MQTIVTRAIDHIGLTKLANRFDVWASAVQKWRDKGFLPESDLSGRTEYAAGIEELSEGKFSAEELLEATREAWRKTPLRRGKRKRAAR
jgi:hypothetical protein